MSPQVPTKDIVSIRCYFQELIKGMDITAFVPPDTDQVLAGSAGSARPGRWAVPNRAFCPSKHGRIFCSRQCRVQHQNQMKRQSIPKTHLPLLSSSTLGCPRNECSGILPCIALPRHGSRFPTEMQSLTPLLISFRDFLVSFSKAKRHWSG